jgi:hypothetical protein
MDNFGRLFGSYDSHGFVATIDVLSSLRRSESEGLSTKIASAVHVGNAESI